MSVYEAKVKICDTVAELPSAATEGLLAYCRDDDFARVYNGSAWMSFPRTVIKNSGETRSSNSTMTADSELVVPLGAGVWFAFELNAQFNTSAAADFKFDFNYTGTHSVYREYAIFIVPAAGTASISTPHTTIGTDTVALSGSAGEGSVLVNGSILTTTAGTLQFRWAQNTSDASNTTVRNGARLTVYRI